MSTAGIVALVAALGLPIAVVSFEIGWQLARLRHPGAIGMGDRVDIKHGQRVVARMFLTEFHRQLNGPSEARLESIDSYLSARRVDR